MKHWAFDLIGKPYALGAHGPDSFDCWGFVRWAFIHHLGVPDMPVINVGETSNFMALREAAARSGWRPTATPDPQPDDVVLMDSFHGLHVGIVTKANNSLGVVHALQDVGVCFSKFQELRCQGFRNFTYWRKQK